jgi:hypothetical protein
MHPWSRRSEMVWLPTIGGVLLLCSVIALILFVAAAGFTDYILIRNSNGTLSKHWTFEPFPVGAALFVVLIIAIAGGRRIPFPFKPNQSPDPTPAPGMPPAEQESRHG